MKPTIEKYSKVQNARAGGHSLPRLVRLVKCLAGNHRYTETQKLSSESRRVACPDCGKVWAMNDDTRSLLPWDADFHRMYERHGIAIQYLDWEFRKPNRQVTLDS